VTKPHDDPAPRNGAEAYKALPKYAATRHGELSDMIAPAIDVTDAYGLLISRAVWILGEVPTRDNQDKVLRDLTSDVFDFLVASRRAVFEGQLGVGYPLARRAYESLSLMAVCAQDPSFAERWHAGAQIGNAEVRKALSRLPFGESEAELRELYKFFSKGSHPNRELIPERFLGDGNGFTLGSIGMPDLVLTVDACLNLLRLWAWFAPILGHFYQSSIDSHDPHWGRDYLAAHRDAEKVGQQLISEYNRLLAETKAAYDENGIKKPTSKER
jgi:hypothetical protein